MALRKPSLQWRPRSPPPCRATRTGSQKNGDRCWGFLLQEGEELREEESQLDYVHPADVVALSEGAQGDATAMIDLLLRNAQLVMHFVPIGGEQFRQLMAAIVVWRQRNSGGSIFVDTQTTDKGEQEQPPPLDSEKWVPPLDGRSSVGGLWGSSRNHAKRSPTEGRRE